MYIAEIAPPKHRGQLVSLYQLAVVFGFLIVFIVTYFIGGEHSELRPTSDLDKVHEYNIVKGWRIMFWSEIIPAISFLILLFSVPHTPRWLLMKLREKEAVKVLSKFISDEGVIQKEFNEIKLSLSTSKSSKGFSYIPKGLGIVLFIGIMLSVFQQISGINAILYYGAEIFSNALGYGPEDALKQQLWLGSVNLIFTFVAILTIDKWGRKPLLIVGTIGMILSLSILGFSIYYQQLGVVSLISILGFVGFFALSMGPVVWVLLSEIFPNSIRSFAMSIAVAVQWFTNAIVANSYPAINRSVLNESVFHGSLPYFIFSFMCLVALVFIIKLVPETKGKSLEQIELTWKQ